MERKVLIAVSDMFFAARIRQTAEQVGVTPTFAKRGEQVLDLARSEKPTLIIFDLNDAHYRPLETIARLKADPELAQIKALGYLSHVQTDLHQQASEAGCDHVLAKSAFTQLLPKLLTQ